MLDPIARRLIDPSLTLVGGHVARLGIPANAVTLVGLTVGLGGAIAIGQGAFLLAIAAILASRFLDGLDGATARASRPTDFGGYLDIVCDFAFYGAIPLGFILYDPAANGVAGGFLLASFYLNGASFLGFAILAAKMGMETRKSGLKSLYYSDGLLEGTETIGFFLVLCLWPQNFAVMAWVFGGLCCVTALLRVYAANKIFN